MYKLTNQLINKKLHPDEAKKWDAYNNYPGQRPRSEAKARRYSELLKQGMLRPVEIAFATCPDGNRYLMNGQHVLQGCIWAAKEMSCIVSYYKCETWQDAYELFATFDVHATRTQDHIFNAARVNFANEQLRDVPLRSLGSCGTALAILSTAVPSFQAVYKIADKTTKVHLVERHASEVIWIARFSDTRFLMKVGAVTAMIATRRKNPSKAEEFWSKVQSGLGYKTKQDPEKKVRELLTSAAVGKNSRSEHEATYAVCISWWNTAITGEARSSVKFASMKELPKVLA